MVKITVDLSLELGIGETKNRVDFWRAAAQTVEGAGGARFRPLPLPDPNLSPEAIEANYDLDAIERLFTQRMADTLRVSLPPSEGVESLTVHVRGYGSILLSVTAFGAAVEKVPEILTKLDALVGLSATVALGMTPGSGPPPRVRILSAGPVAAPGPPAAAPAPSPSSAPPPAAPLPHGPPDAGDAGAALDPTRRWPWLYHAAVFGRLALGVLALTMLVWTYVLMMQNEALLQQSVSAYKDLSASQLAFATALAVDRERVHDVWNVSANLDAPPPCCPPGAKGLAPLGDAGGPPKGCCDQVVATLQRLNDLRNGDAGAGSGTASR
jgi:hypothetical protein